MTAPFTSAELAAHRAWIAHQGGTRIVCVDRDFTSVDFADLVLTAARFERCNFTSSSWRGACLNQAELVDCDLCGADLGQAELQESRFTNCRVVDVDLRNANIVGTAFEGGLWQDVRMGRTWWTEATWDGQTLDDTAASVPFFPRPDHAGVAELARADDEPCRRPQFVAYTRRLAWTLDANLAAFNEFAAEAKPTGLDDDATAQHYLHAADAWTSASEGGELLLHRWSDIPFVPDLSATETVWIQVTRDMLAQHIEPPTLLRSPTGWALTKWVVANRQLILRTLTTTFDGQVCREDTVYESELPCPNGDTWTTDEAGRLVPTD